MMEDKEREIRLQFLDEAEEYLDTLEGAVLGIAQRGVDNAEMNVALRAAHSIKGGAALMGYSLTSDLAHRLEDALKVVKIGRGEGVTSDVEGQLLSAMDAVRQIVERDRNGVPLDDPWVANFVGPIFENLYDTLGEPSAEDAASMMDADEGQDILPLIFQTEVEGTLEKLEALLEESPSELQSEIVVMAQELSALGEMLDLPPFIQLCQSVEAFAAGAATGDQLQEVGQSALQAWRRAQALVITGTVESMPSALTDISFGLIEFEAGDRAFGDEDDALVNDIFAGLGDEDDALINDVFADLHAGELDIDQMVGMAAADSEAADFEAADAEKTNTEKIDLEGTGTEETELEEADAFAGVFDEADQAASSEAASDRQNHRASGTEFRFSETPRAQTEEAEIGDNTVRVSVRKLNELNDYFGELTIERNRLEAEVRRTRRLVKSLSRKLRSLDELNDDFKDLYEQSNSTQFLLPGQLNNALLPSSASADTSGNLSTEDLSAENLSVKQLNAVNAGAVSTTAAATPANAQANAQSAKSQSAKSQSAKSQKPQNNGDPHEFEQESKSAFHHNFDSLEFDRYSDAHLSFREIVESVVKLQEVADDIELSVDKTEQTTRVIHRTARHLQRTLNYLRMRPLADITNRFPRALRELEIEHGKSVELLLEGENTLIDRNILEALSDPLMHIVRNAFDHGIETPQKRESKGKSGRGTIAIRAANHSSRTVITVSDDGNGIALDKIRDRAQSMGLDAELLSAASDAELLSLIFEPGFSTSEAVTALSGRGVGMDVVRNNLTQIRGDISVDTKAGKGTIFTLSVPYTLSVTRVMLAEGNRMLVAIPTDMIEEVNLSDPADMYETEGKPMLHFRGDAIRLIELSNWLTFNCSRQIETLEQIPTLDQPSVLIFRMGDQRMGLKIDRSWGDQEVAVRRVEGPISLPAGFSNCTILGDGRVVPLMSLPDLVRWVLNCEGTGINSAAALYSNPVANGAIDPISLQMVPDKAMWHRPRFLVVDDSVNVRRLLALTLEKAGYEVAQARDGQDALEKLETGVEIDSIVCDVEMPRMDGYSLLSRLRSLPKFAKIPVTMLTSRSGEKHRNLAMNLGATAYFSKPYQEQSLLKSLANSLAAAAKDRESGEWRSE
ncbi:MAG: response regulator [Phormidesmis sp.]